MPPPRSLHTLSTRTAHMGFALAIIVQLLTSLAMQDPRRERPGDWLFLVHEYSGLTALGFASLFWLVLLTRHRGTSKALLFPWTSARRRTAVWADARIHLAALQDRRLPPYEEHGPLASAVHGLGLALMSAMALSGGVYYAAEVLDARSNPVVRLIVDLHQLGGNVAWAYLVGHAGLALVHHVTRQLSLTEMWSLRPDRARPAGRQPLPVERR